MLGERIASQSEVIRAIVSVYSPCCGVPHRLGPFDVEDVPAEGTCAPIFTKTLHYLSFPAGTPTKLRAAADGGVGTGESAPASTASLPLSDWSYAKPEP